MPLDPFEYDPRVQPLAYIQDGTNLFQVVRRLKSAAEVVLQNCKTMKEIRVRTLAICTKDTYTLVREAPSVDPPDSPECEATVHLPT